jgi:chemotaxis protein CheY-P-specific phosphatase CheC
MTAITSDKLGELVVEALERTAFLISDPIDSDDASSYGEPTWFSTIAYHGGSKGEIYLSATEGFVLELASSLLGVDADEVDLQTQGRDAINELANIVGGSVTLELGNETSQFSLGLPESASADQLPVESAALTRCFIDAEDELLVISHVAEAGSGRMAA